MECFQSSWLTVDCREASESLMEDCVGHCDLRGEFTERGESGWLGAELGSNGSSGKGLFLWSFVDAFLLMGKPSFDTCRW